MVKRRRFLFAAALFLTVTIAAGCLYRGEIEKQLQHPLFVREELDRVAAAVKRYKEAHGTYPIRNSDASVPVYEKYILDLQRLIDGGMLSSLPRNAFEAGGSFYYLVVHPETEPTIMLMDIAAVQRVGEMQKEVDAYRAASGGNLPALAEIAPGYYSLDYEALRRKPLYIQSRYSQQFLPLLLHESGQVLIDYSLDIVKAAKEAEGEPLAEGEDAREWLVRASPYAPVKSPPYRWIEGEPVLGE